MRNQLLAVMAVGLVLAASPLLAQETNPATTASQPAPQADQSGQNATTSASQGDAQEVMGTISSISSDRLELKVESAPSTTGGASSALIGKTVSFALSTSTDMPAGLRTGDRVSIWFSREGGNRQATRVALAEASDASSEQPSTASTTESGSSTGGNTSSASTASTTGTSSPSSTVTNPSSNQPEAATSGAHSQTLPKTASQLPLVALIGLAALVAAVALRFVLKAF